MRIIAEPVFTTVLPSVDKLRPLPRSLYITGVSVEERSHHTKEWESKCGEVCFARFDVGDRSSATFLVNDYRCKISLRGRRSISRFIGSGNFRCYYIDVTGLSHHVWAPLLRVLREQTKPVYCVYVEPADYTYSENPTEATIFDLSEKIEGISPLPGFASFPEVFGRESLFVPLLGFEGTRFAHMLEHVQPEREFILPIIGVPGFRPEYPFYSYVGNRTQLQDTRSWENVRFVPANCPFSLYHLLTRISSQHRGRPMTIAMIGTKPHAVGAVLFYLDHPRCTELVYDHPVRKLNRTLGTSRVCIYNLSLWPMDNH